MLRYDPIADGKGGFPMNYGSGLTKPGGHYKEIKQLQRGLKRDLKTYNQRCRCDDNDDGNPPITRNVDELANELVPPPFIKPSAILSPSTLAPPNFLWTPPSLGVPVFVP
jgi:hypothetical protein